VDKNTVLEYLAFIVLRDVDRMREHRMDISYVDIIDTLYVFVILYTPSILLSLHLCMPSKIYNNRCIIITGTLCALGFIAAVFVPGRIITGWDGFGFGVSAGIASIAGAIVSIIGFNVRKYLDGKTYRKTLSLWLILIHFVARSVFWFWRMVL
jgi:hypothetical protein